MRDDLQLNDENDIENSMRQSNVISRRGSIDSALSSTVRTGLTKKLGNDENRNRPRRLLPNYIFKITKDSFLNRKLTGKSSSNGDLEKTIAMSSVSLLQFRSSHVKRLDLLAPMTCHGGRSNLEELAARAIKTRKRVMAFTKVHLIHRLVRSKINS